MAESDAFGMFFMPEEVRKQLAEAPRAVMFLLQASPFDSVTVGRGSTHEKAIKIRKGGQVRGGLPWRVTRLAHCAQRLTVPGASSLPLQVAVWEFSVQSLDIGFKVEFDGAPVAEYMMVKANGSEPSETVRGRFSAPRAGKLVLCWDNSYSMYAQPPPSRTAPRHATHCAPQSHRCCGPHAHAGAGCGPSRCLCVPTWLGRR